MTTTEQHSPARFSPEPILDYFDQDPNGPERKLDIDRIAQACGIHRRRVVRWISDGTTMNDRCADEIATRLGFHPDILWPDYTSTLGADCQAPDCERHQDVLRHGLCLAHYNRWRRLGKPDKDTLAPLRPSRKASVAA